MDRPTLDDLPFEIKLEIFSYLPVKDLVSCSLVCKRWMNESNHNSIWKMHCRLDQINLDVCRTEITREDYPSSLPGVPLFKQLYVRHADTIRNWKQNTGQLYTIPSRQTPIATEVVENSSKVIVVFDNNLLSLYQFASNGFQHLQSFTVLTKDSFVSVSHFHDIIALQTMENLVILKLNRGFLSFEKFIHAVKNPFKSVQFHCSSQAVKKDSSVQFFIAVIMDDIFIFHVPSEASLHFWSFREERTLSLICPIPICSYFKAFQNHLYVYNRTCLSVYNSLGKQVFLYRVDEEFSYSVQKSIQISNSLIMSVIKSKMVSTCLKFWNHKYASQVNVKGLIHGATLHPRAANVIYVTTSGYDESYTIVNRNILKDEITWCTKLYNGLGLCSLFADRVNLFTIKNRFILCIPRLHGYPFCYCSFLFDLRSGNNLWYAANEDPQIISYVDDTLIETITFRKSIFTDKTKKPCQWNFTRF